MRRAIRSFLALLGWWDLLRTPGPSRILGLNGLVDASGLGLAAVCLPFYLIQVAGLSAAQVASILIVGGVVELLGAVPAGALAGRVGVGRYSVLTRVGRAVACLAMAFTTHYLALILIMAIMGALRAGNGGLMQSLLGSAVPDANRTTMLAGIRALRNIGYLVAGSAGAMLLGFGSPMAMRAGLLVNAVTFAVGAYLVLQVKAGPAVTEARENLDWSVLRDLNYLGLIASSAVFSSSLLVLDVALPLWVLRTSTIPMWTVGAVLVINTAMVIVLQHRFSQEANTVRTSVRSLWIACAGFTLMAGLFSVSVIDNVLIGTLSVLLAGTMLTVGELYEGPAWWTISYELAPKERNAEYLAAFDLNMAAVNIAGPALCVAIVYAGWIGWVVYGALMIAAAAGMHALVAVRVRRTPVAVEVPAAA